jgi:hypothetical protein
MMTLFRRFLVLIALMFWQGGFTFYAAVVVPVGQEELGSHLAQGFITRRVTNYLNLAGAIALVPLAWDLAGSADPSTGRRRWRGLCWLGMTAALAVLIWLHPQLDSLLDLDSQTLLDRARFRTAHRWYLWISTVQWALAVAYTGLTVWTWKEESSGAAAAGSQDCPGVGEEHPVPGTNR